MNPTTLRTLAAGLGLACAVAPATATMRAAEAATVQERAPEDGPTAPAAEAPASPQEPAEPAPRTPHAPPDQPAEPPQEPAESAPGPPPAPSDQPSEPPQPPADAPAERLDEHRVRVGAIVIDHRAGELRVGGKVNPAPVLEYLANARQGYKAYESALELDCTAIEFNTALILLGLDPDHGVPSKEKFEAEPPRGDPVEIWVEWERDGETVRRRAEELLFDAAKGRTLAEGPWVYTGSVLLPDGGYLAELDGVLIGFMHTPESIVDSPRELQSAWGDVRLHPNLGLEAGTAVEVVVRRLAEDASGEDGPG